MLFNVVAEVEIDGKPITNHISISLDQRFNAHHRFLIRLPLSVLEKDFTLNNIKNLLGKVSIIRFKSGIGQTVVNEFKGIITDVGIEQNNFSHAEIVLKGSSPTIILDHGDHVFSFLEKDLKFICGVATNFVKSEIKVTVNPVFKSKLAYITQYRESSFEFLNRLSAEFGEWFFFDGKELFFGKPSLNRDLDLILGEDVTGLQHTLQLVPLSSFDFSYNVNTGSHNAKDPISKGTPETVEPLGILGKHAAQQSDSIFDPVDAPFIRPHPNTDEEAEKFLKLLKLQNASKLEVISGTSTNPEILLGTVATILISKKGTKDFVKSEEGKYIITSVSHQISQDGRYFNHFEGVPSALAVLPVHSYKKIIAETQLAIVRSNNDPKKQNRVKVQMLWQEQNNTTDWVSVMSPDTGLGDKDKKNRGFIFIPEEGDLVYVGFKYNDPNLPFVLGSVIDKSDASGGGKDNKLKTLSSKKGNIVTFNDEHGSLEMKDVNGDSVHIGGGKISINSSDEILLKCGDSSIQLKKDGKIFIDVANDIELTAGQNIKITAGTNVQTTAGTDIISEGGNNIKITGSMKIDMTAGSEIALTAGGKLSAKADGSLELEGSGMAKLSSPGITELTGSMVKIN